MNPSAPSRRSRLALHEINASSLSSHVEIATKESLPWMNHVASLNQEVKSLNEWLRPRRLEEEADNALLALIENKVKAIWSDAKVRQERNGTMTRLAGDPLVLTVVTTEKKSNDTLTSALETEDWAWAIDHLASASMRNGADRIIPFDQDPPSPILLVEGSLGGRVAVVFLMSAIEASATRNILHHDKEAPPWLLLTARAAGCELSSYDANEIWKAAAAARSVNSPMARQKRGDEASIELCRRPLYTNEAGVLIADGSEITEDDELFISFASCCKAHWQDLDTADARPRFIASSERFANQHIFSRRILSRTAKAVSQLMKEAVARKRNKVLTSDALRRQARLATYASGQFIDDQGIFQPLDRTLVDEIKQLMMSPDRALSPLGLSSPSTRLVLRSDDQDSAPPPLKRQRGGEILRVVKHSRSVDPTREPRSLEDQHRAAAHDCAQLEVAHSKHQGSVYSSLLALPVGPLIALRARQLLQTLLLNGLRTRADDFLRSTKYHMYSTLERRCTLQGVQLDLREALPQSLSVSTNENKGKGDAALRSGDIFKALAWYTTGLIELNPIVLLDRAQAFLAAGLPQAAIRDATQALALAPSWFPALTKLANALQASDSEIDHKVLQLLIEYATIIDPKASFRILDSRSKASDKFFLDTSDTTTFESAKQTGDDAFRSKRFVDAIAAYSMAIHIASRAHKTTQSSRSLAAVFSNRAAASIALQAHTDALLDGIAAARLAPEWHKGHLRIASALRALHRPHDAIEAYFNALRILPDDIDLKLGFCDAFEELQAQERQTR